jgi:uncharacterized protein YndB with AHSA1/START domain
LSNAVHAIDTNILRVRRIVAAKPGRVFKAWTEPDEVQKWWGPKGVRCLSVAIDLKVNGRYRIANELPDGSVLWISGTYEVIERPHRLVYTWLVENKSPQTERVEVHFAQHDLGTEVTIMHQRIASKALREQHQQGWEGGLHGLAEYLHGPWPGPDPRNSLKQK